MVPFDIVILAVAHCVGLQVALELLVLWNLGSSYQDQNNEDAKRIRRENRLKTTFRLKTARTFCMNRLPARHTSIA